MIEWFDDVYYNDKARILRILKLNQDYVLKIINNTRRKNKLKKIINK